MSQTRLFLRLNRADAARAFDALESEFEDEGLPVGVLEIDVKLRTFRNFRSIANAIPKRSLTELSRFYAR
jgi:cell fate regulator YaaT (PSP1 superfamily)